MVRVSDGGAAKQNATSNKIRIDCFVTFVPRNDVMLTANYFLFFTTQRMNSERAAMAKASTMVQPMNP